MWIDPLIDADFISNFWADAEDLDQVTLNSLLDASFAVCVAYAPALAEGAPIPDNYRIAQIMQARHIWSQMQGGNREQIGADGFAISTYPLTFAARDLLRPKTSPLGRLR